MKTISIKNDIVPIAEFKTSLSKWFKSLRSTGHPVVITQGERGMLRGTDQHVERWPAFQVEAVDTTAAGDVFHGAFAYGVVTGLSDDATLRLAAAAAALSATARGGRTSIPSLLQVQEMLRHAR